MCNKEVQKLVEIYRGFSGSKDFPADFCDHVADAIQGELGYKMHFGAFLLDKPRVDYYGNMRCISWCHTFCEDNEGRIVDLTAAQFNSWLNIPFPSGILLIPKRVRLSNRYVKEVYPYPCDPLIIKPFFAT